VAHSTATPFSGSNPHLAWVLAALWAVLCWALLTTPPPPPGALPSWLPLPAALALPGVDKLGHGALFLVQALLVHRALLARSRWRGWRPLAAAVVLAAAWGAATELRQAWVPGREADAFDLLADVAGSSLYAVARAISRRTRGS
jgi:VanZ family protein